MMSSYCVNWLKPVYKMLPQWLSSKESACSGGDAGSIAVLGRSPGEGNCYPL